MMTVFDLSYILRRFLFVLRGFVFHPGPVASFCREVVLPMTIVASLFAGILYVCLALIQFDNYKYDVGEEVMVSGEYPGEILEYKSVSGDSPMYRVNMGGKKVWLTEDILTRSK